VIWPSALYAAALLQKQMAAKGRDSILRDRAAL